MRPRRVYIRRWPPRQEREPPGYCHGETGVTNGRLVPDLAGLLRKHPLNDMSLRKEREVLAEAPVSRHEALPALRRYGSDPSR